MTEADWLAWTNLDPPYEFLRGRASERKFRLFACACARRVLHLLADDCYQQAIEVAERYADGLESTKTLLEARDIAYQAANTRRHNLAVRGAAYAAWNAANESHETGGANVAAASAWNAATAAGLDQFEPDIAERKAPYRLLCDILVPEACPVPAPLWLAWSDGIVVKLARGIYEDRAFDRLPILADALEEAGCSDTSLLAHLRGPGPHVRGCWVLDLLLDRK
jgi:hypothetical protein